MAARDVLLDHATYHYILPLYNFQLHIYIIYACSYKQQYKIIPSQVSFAH